MLTTIYLSQNKAKAILILFAFTCLLCLRGAAAHAAAAGEQKPEIVGPGDLVAVDYVAVMKTGQLVGTTLAKIANDTNRKKAAAFQQPSSFEPLEFLAGREASFPGIASEVVGMAVGEKKKVVVPPSSAFGPKDADKIQRKARIRRMPRIVTLRPDQWVRKFSNFPRVGDEVRLSPYYQSRVIEVQDQWVRLEALVRENETITAPSPAGTVEVKIDGDEVAASFQPDIGAAYPQGDQVGRIISVDDTTFEVDFNPTLAGEPITVELEVVDLVKASEFDEEIVWLENHDQGLQKASETGKPAVLVLYAGWCGWSERLLSESMTDPRIKMYKDQLVWLKIDSDQQKNYKEQYGQSGYPMTVLLDKDGRVVNRLDGFRDAAAIKKELAKLVKS